MDHLVCLAVHCCGATYTLNRANTAAQRSGRERQNSHRNAAKQAVKSDTAHWNGMECPQCLSVCLSAEIGADVRRYINPYSSDDENEMK